MQNKESAEKRAFEKMPEALRTIEKYYAHTNGKETVNGIVSKYNKMERITWRERRINE